MCRRHSIAASRADLTLAFPRPCDVAAGPDGDGTASTLIAGPTAHDAWAVRWHLTKETADRGVRCSTMQAVCPVFIPRNHVVEAVLYAAVARHVSLPSKNAQSAVATVCVQAGLRPLHCTARSSGARETDILRHLISGPLGPRKIAGSMAMGARPVQEDYLPRLYQ